MVVVVVARLVVVGLGAGVGGRAISAEVTPDAVRTESEREGGREDGGEVEEETVRGWKEAEDRGEQRI